MYTCIRALYAKAELLTLLRVMRSCEAGPVIRKAELGARYARMRSCYALYAKAELALFRYA